MGGKPMDVGGGESASGGIGHKWGRNLEDTMKNIRPNQNNEWDIKHS